MTLTDLQTRLDAYKAAELKVLQGQEYTISDGAINRRMRRADLAEIRAEIANLDAEIERLTAQAAGTRRVLYIR